MEGYCVSVLRGHTKFINCCVLKRAYDRAVSGSRDGTVRCDPRSLQSVSPVRSSLSAIAVFGIWMGMR